MALKSSLSVFIGIPQLSQHDQYSGYLGSVLNYINAQETEVKLLKPYVTPAHTGKFQAGTSSKLEAIVGRMNNIVDKFMVSDASHLFINDGDVEIPPHTIDTLIRHNVDVASGVYPYQNFRESNAMIFGRMAPNNPCGNLILRDWSSMKGQVFGEKDKWSGGSGCMLIKRRVFKKYHPKLHPLRFTRRAIDRICGADMYFWKRVQDAGFTARVDANVVCGHIPNCRLKDIDKWLT